MLQRSADSPDVAIVDVEGQTQDAQKDSEAGEDGHSSEKLLGQIAELFDHHGAVSRRPCTWTARREKETEQRLRLRPCVSAIPGCAGPGLACT